jgi:hypothetical protein
VHLALAPQLLGTQLLVLLVLPLLLREVVGLGRVLRLASVTAGVGPEAGASGLHAVAAVQPPRSLGGHLQWHTSQGSKWRLVSAI